jgi:hypothetical protein
VKNVAYAILLLASFALGIFGAFMAYHGIGLPSRIDQTMSDCTAIGVLCIIAAGFGVVMTCSHAIHHSR